MGCGASISDSAPTLNVGVGSPIHNTSTHAIISRSAIATEVDNNAPRRNRLGESGKYLLEMAGKATESPGRALTSDELKNVYRGNFTKIKNIPMNKSLVRIFTSSTFVDFKDWRNELMSDVYSFLQEMCAIIGLEFSVVDMR
jgi:hypothetical protein